MSQQYLGQQYVQSQQPNGYGQVAPGQYVGVPQQGAPQPQVQQPSGYSGYSIDHLPPPPQRGPQQGNYGNVPGVSYGQPPAQQGYGVPGAQVQQPAYVPPQQLQQFAPQQQPGLPPQQFPQGQQFQQPQQFAPQQPPAGPQLGFAPAPNTILDGPNVPPELRGRTWGDAIRLYNGLATDWRQRNAQPQTPAAQTQQQMQQPSGLPPQFPQGQQPSTPQSFFQNPDERIAQVVRQQIEQTVMPALQPVIAMTSEQRLLQARAVASQQMPDFQQLEPDIMSTLASAPPESLGNPQVWIAAARMARGRAIEEGRYRPVQQQTTTTTHQVQVPGTPQGWQGPGAATPAAQPYQFFTESPTAPSAFQYGASGAPQPTQADYQQASKFGMDIGTWMLWKTGQPMQGQPQQAGGFR